MRPSVTFPVLSGLSSLRLPSSPVAAGSSALSAGAGSPLDGPLSTEIDTPLVLQSAAKESPRMTLAGGKLCSHKCTATRQRWRAPGPARTVAVGGSDVTNRIPFDDDAGLLAANVIEMARQIADCGRVQAMRMYIETERYPASFVFAAFDATGAEKHDVFEAA